MARSHYVKCLYCGETFNTEVEEWVKPRSNRYAHASCAEKVELTKTQIDKDRENLEEYIKQLFHIESISTKIKRQIDSYVKKNEYSYVGILKALKYFYEIRSNSIEKANGGIGIVPYVYEESLIYWNNLRKAQEINSKVEINDYILPTKEVHIIEPKRTPMRHLRKQFDFLEGGTE